MEVPKNCWECKHSHDCEAWHYGGDGCKYEDEVNRAAIVAMEQSKK